MRERLYLLVALATALCLAGWTAHAQLQRGSSARQAWEYKAIRLERNTIAENWSSWYDDDKPLPGPVNRTAKRVELGNQGWELVAVVAIADTTGGATTRMFQFYKRPK
jgi:hypothetical protein